MAERMRVEVRVRVRVSHSRVRMHNILNHEFPKGIPIRYFDREITHTHTQKEGLINIDGVYSFQWGRERGGRGKRDRKRKTNRIHMKPQWTENVI